MLKLVNFCDHCVTRNDCHSNRSLPGIVSFVNNIMWNKYMYTCIFLNVSSSLVNRDLYKKDVDMCGSCVTLGNSTPVCLIPASCQWVPEAVLRLLQEKLKK